MTGNISVDHGFGAIGLLLALFSMVFWMVVGWRAMRAHEKIADAAERAVDNTGNDSTTTPGTASSTMKKPMKKPSGAPQVGRPPGK